MMTNGSCSRSRCPSIGVLSSSHSRVCCSDFPPACPHKARLRRVDRFSFRVRPRRTESFLKLLRPELERLGWIDGQNILLLEPQTAEGKNERMPLMAAELVAHGPDDILAQSVPATFALMWATKSIPIVMIGLENPVELGIVADFRKPGGNVPARASLPTKSPASCCST